MDMNQTHALKRLEALEHAQRRVVLQPMIDQLSAATGVSGDELWEEASRVAEVCAAHGVTTSAGMIAHYAQKLEVSPEVLEADVDYYRAIAA